MKALVIILFASQLKSKIYLIVLYDKIKEIMRDKFNMSYKRVNARPKLYVNMTTFLARYLFSAKFVENITENHLIINIDE